MDDVMPELEECMAGCEYDPDTRTYTKRLTEAEKAELALKQATLCPFKPADAEISLICKTHLSVKCWTCVSARETLVHSFAGLRIVPNASVDINYALSH